MDVFRQANTLFDAVRGEVDARVDAHTAQGTAVDDAQGLKLDFHAGNILPILGRRVKRTGGMPEGRIGTGGSRAA